MHEICTKQFGFRNTFILNCLTVSDHFPLMCYQYMHGAEKSVSHRSDFFFFFFNLFHIIYFFTAGIEIATFKNKVHSQTIDLQYRSYWTRRIRLFIVNSHSLCLG